MKFAVQINANPYQSQGGETAYRFIAAALAKGHQVLRVFFYQDAIGHALRHAWAPEDECSIVGRWSELARTAEIDLVVCISAAQRRGLLCTEVANERGKQDQDLAEGFRIAGLGQWVEALLTADRVLVFR